MYNPRNNCETSQKLKFEDNINKLSERDHQKLTPRSSIGPDEHASRLKQTQFDHSFDLQNVQHKDKSALQQKSEILV